MTMASIIAELTVIARVNPAITHLVISLMLGVFVGGVVMLLFTLGTIKKGEALDGAFYKKLAVWGACGLLAGTISMKITIRQNPDLFRSKPPMSQKQLQAVSENPIPKQFNPSNVTNPFGNDESREEAAERLEAEKRKFEERRKEREAEALKRREEAEAAKAQRELDEQKDMEYLATLSLAELEKLKEERQLEIDEAKEVMRQPSADTEVRKAASQRFGAAVQAYQRVFRAVMDKKREERELNR